MVIPGSARCIGPTARALAAFALVTFAAAPLAAEEEKWRDFTFDDKGFTIQFPVEPSRSDVHYRAATADGGEVEVPATRIAATQDHTVYDVTVAEFAGTAAAGADAIEHAVQRLTRRGELGLDTLVSIQNSDCGRYIGYADPDGTLNYYGLFYFPQTQRFYDIHARLPPSDQADHGAGASHFGLSLSFLDSAAPTPAIPPTWPEEWKQYSYAGPEFSIRFPAPPTEERLDFTTPSGVTVPARRFSLNTGGVELRVTAAKYWETDADTIDTGQAATEGGAQWAEAARAGGHKVVYDHVASLARAQCGRELRTTGPVDRHARIFFPATQHWLYIVETSGPTPAPGEPDPAALFQAGFAVISAPEPGEVSSKQSAEVE